MISVHQHLQLKVMVAYYRLEMQLYFSALKYSIQNQAGHILGANQIFMLHTLQQILPLMPQEPRLLSMLVLCRFLLIGANLQAQPLLCHHSGFKILLVSACLSSSQLHTTVILGFILITTQTSIGWTWIQAQEHPLFHQIVQQIYTGVSEMTRLKIYQYLNRSTLKKLRIGILATTVLLRPSYMTSQLFHQLVVVTCR